MPPRVMKVAFLASAAEQGLLHAGARDRRRLRHCASASHSGRITTPSAASLRRASRRATSTATTANAQTAYCTVHATRNASGV